MFTFRQRSSVAFPYIYYSFTSSRLKLSLSHCQSYCLEGVCFWHAWESLEAHGWLWTKPERKQGLERFQVTAVQSEGTERENVKSDRTSNCKEFLQALRRPPWPTSHWLQTAPVSMALASSSKQNRLSTDHMTIQMTSNFSKKKQKHTEGKED